jgi:hypothetical protein
VAGQVAHHRERRLRAQKLCGSSKDPGSGKVGGQTESPQTRGAVAASALRMGVGQGQKVD